MDDKKIVRPLHSISGSLYT
uniref:Uncharacterized protein n=1 Tax=Arundo donax TaxID=35708 RepID=A0A0A9EEX5_ARUDO